MNPYDIIIPPARAGAFDAMSASEYEDVVRCLAGAAVGALTPHHGLSLELHRSVHSVPAGDRQIRYRVDRAHQTLRVLSLGSGGLPRSLGEQRWENEGGHCG